MNTKTSSPDRLGFAVSMILSGTLIITASDLIAKSVIPYLSIWLLLFLRSIIGLGLLFGVLLIAKKLHSVKTINLKAVLVRSLLMSISYLCFYTALATVPIALVAGAFFCGPFFMVLLSRIMLGETFGLWRTMSLIVGFIGVLLVIQPSSNNFNPLLIIGLFSAFFYAMTQVVTRKYCKNENPIALSYWLTIVFMVTGIIGIVFLWLNPSLEGTDFLNRPASLDIPLTPFLLLCFMSICSIVMHFALSAAYQNSPSNLIAPLEYLYLPLATIGGYIFYQETPNTMALYGIVLIILAGLVVVWRKGT